MHRSLLIALALLGGTLAAQPPTPATGGAAAVTVHGIVYDSLRDRPLAGAFVTLDDGGRSTQSDARGRFAFDDVAPGPHAIAVQHAALDSAGLTGIARRVTVTDGRDDLLIATPSFATLWRSVCGDDRAPADSGFVYGVVADARRGARLGGATVDLRWMQLAAAVREGQPEITQRPWRAIARTGASGAYAICGVPIGVSLRIQAATDSAATGLVDIPPGDARVLRRDLVVGPVESSASGIVSGVVTNDAGAPFPDARIVTDGVPETRSDRAGRFVLHGVPLGTRQVEVLAVGTSPATVVVDVLPNDTAAVTVPLRKVTTLDVVRVTASSNARRVVREIEERRRQALGYVRDSTEIARHSTLASVFDEFPGARMEPMRGSSLSRFSVTMANVSGLGRCTAPVFIDGVRADYDYLSALHPDEIAVVEVYPHASAVPTSLTTSGDCGIVVVWTKQGLR